MKHKHIFFFVLTGIAAVLSGCKRDQLSALPENSAIAFYNASQVLRVELEQKNPVNVQQPAYILINTGVPVKPDSLSFPLHKDFPFFAISVGGQQFYPIVNGSNATPPWINYMRVAPGKQDIAFLKTDTTLAVKTTVNAQINSETTVFLTDSLGEFQTITTNDAHALFAKGISLRVIHAAPDTGRLMVKVNKAWLSSRLSYRSVSSFYDIPLADSLQSDLFRIQVSPASDTTVVLGKYVLKSDRMRSYTLIINGYLDVHEETNYINPDFRLSIIRNK